MKYCRNCRHYFEYLWGKYKRIVAICQKNHVPTYREYIPTKCKDYAPRPIKYKRIVAETTNYSNRLNKRRISPRKTKNKFRQNHNNRQNNK